MKKFKNYLFASVGFLVLMLTISLTGIGTSIAQTASECVRICTDEPLRVVVENIARIQIASSSRAPVYITQALLVTDVFQKEIDISLNEGQADGSAHITVPPGKLLDIKSFSGTAVVRNGQFAVVDVVTQANGNTASHKPLMNFLGSAQGDAMYSFGYFGDTYADPGSDIEVSFHRGTGSPNPKGMASLNITLSGHYINQ